MSADWIRRMEQAVRRQAALPIDAFLPELQAGYLEAGSLEEGPPPAPEPGAEPLGVPFSERPEPRSRRPAPPRREESTRGLDAEIQEFMNKDQRGIAEDDDFSDFLGSGIDPNLDE
ncbi:MAG: hypothetical protein PVF68_02670 [Acidobacteriota bacterium]|jgi:hypothetical protein